MTPNAAAAGSTIANTLSKMNSTAIAKYQPVIFLVADKGACKPLTEPGAATSDLSTVVPKSAALGCLNELLVLTVELNQMVPDASNGYASKAIPSQ